MTKKRSSEIVDDRRTFLEIFQGFRIWSENKLSTKFSSPIFMTNLRLWLDAATNSNLMTQSMGR